MKMSQKWLNQKMREDKFIQILVILHGKDEKWKELEKQSTMSRAREAGQQLAASIIIIIIIIIVSGKKEPNENRKM